MLQFDLGQQLCEPNDIPARILVLLKGQARLVGRQKGRLTTVGKFGPGSVIGAASLLTGNPCENVIASGEVVACAISDQDWADLYATENSFRDWCDQQLWPQELLSLLETLDVDTAETESSPIDQLEPVLKSAQRCLPEPDSIEAAIQAGKRLFLTSSWGQARLGRAISTSSELPPADRFAHRLVALPADHVIADKVAGVPGGELVPADDAEKAELLPPVSRFSPERNVIESLRLIRGDGAIQETLACFQMLAQLMKLPFRRDSIEKVLQDNIRRGLSPNLQLCGQLAASLGLHVMAAKVPADAGTRLQVPSMLPWQGGFALVVASSEQGLKLASPKEGLVTLDPQDLAESFPEGIELLLMERSNATPDQKFGPAWFWPAL